MKKLIIVALAIFFISCKDKPTSTPDTPEKESTDLSDISTKDFREFKVLDSKNLTKAEIWETIDPQLADFKEADYERLKPYILEKDITELQIHRTANEFTYEELTKFYLYRIRKYDRENPLSLNSVIAIHPDAIEEAKLRDRDFLNRRMKHPIHGMPILLKDNINASDMATTAGAIALQDNNANDAFIVERLKEKGALILGKANLSEWAYFFCGDCPSGYSAIGGQTLNPYGRRIMDTGGSSSGSGVSVAANFCAAAIGSETSGSILSPSSQNSVVGLKPTIGLVSRGGIVPISSTLDTAGPMTKTVRDNAIVLDAIYGYDMSDSKSINLNKSQVYYSQYDNDALEGKRFGAFKRLLEDSLYVNAITILKEQGAEVVEVEEEDLKLPDFIRLLNLDMRKDLPHYLENHASKTITLKSVQDVIDYNAQDSLQRAPYGQRLFKGIVTDEGTDQDLKLISDKLHSNGLKYFENPMKSHDLDGVLSINNYHAGYAAVAEYPALTVPMGYTEKGVPKGLTFISTPFSEKSLLEWAYDYEQASKARRSPENYD